MISIKDAKEIKGKRVLLRVDFNVPLKDGKVVDDFRIRVAIPTISYLQKKGAKIIIISHIGEDGEKSLKPVFGNLKKYVKNVKFVDAPILSNETEKDVSILKNGEVLLFENIRREKGEKENSISFSRGLSRYGDIFVNDAFSVSHRNHASIVGLPKYLPGFAGFQFMDEVKNLSKSFDSKHPFLFILGGAKFETKIPLINKFIKKADYVYIGGAIANDFIKFKGYEVGISLVSPDLSLIKKFSKKENILIPSDVVVSSLGKIRNVKINEINKDDLVIDVGNESIENLKNLVSKSKFILWNGPLGKYEENFGANGTKEILKLIANSNSESIIGGGDTVTLINKLKLKDKFTFVSSGGGSTLDFLANGTLPGIKALK